jgi:type I restriction enzyme R subunit
MLIDGTITKEVYDEKLLEFTRKLHKLSDNGMLTNEEVIEELLKMAQQIRDAHEAGDELGLSEDELAFYDALTKPQAIKDFYENDELIAITKELTEALRKNRSIDWQKRDSARAKMRMMIKRLLKKHKYPPEGMDDAVATVMLQCELWTDNNDMDRRVVSYADAFSKRTQDLQMVAEKPAPYGMKKED